MKRLLLAGVLAILDMGAGRGCIIGLLLNGFTVDESVGGAQWRTLKQMGMQGHHDTARENFSNTPLRAPADYDTM